MCSLAMLTCKDLLYVNLFLKPLSVTGHNSYEDTISCCY